MSEAMVALSRRVGRVMGVSPIADLGPAQRLALANAVARASGFPVLANRWKKLILAAEVAAAKTEKE